MLHFCGQMLVVPLLQVKNGLILKMKSLEIPFVIQVSSTLDLLQVNHFLILDLFISLERSEKIIFEQWSLGQVQVLKS